MPVFASGPLAQEITCEYTPEMTMQITAKSLRPNYQTPTGIAGYN